MKCRQSRLELSQTVTNSQPAIAPIVLMDEFALISDHWNPRIVARSNGKEVRLVKIKGEFTWHSRGEWDEMFVVGDGALEREFRGRIVRLAAGEPQSAGSNDRK